MLCDGEAMLMALCGGEAVVVCGGEAVVVCGGEAVVVVLCGGEAVVLLCMITTKSITASRLASLPPGHHTWLPEMYHPATCTA